MKKIVIGSRGSDLALWQSNYIADCLREVSPDTDVTIEIIRTTGDKITDVPLAKIGGKGIFTKELEVALLEKRVDLAVHSLKDLPTELPAGLTVAAIPVREVPLDAFVSKNNISLDDLPTGARIATSSLRRKVQLLAHRDDLEIVDIRGNVPTRLRKLKDEDLDATILAAAGLRRLGLADAITHEISPEVMLPAVGQGALGLETRTDHDALHALLAKLHHADTAAEVAAERALLAALGGGCQVPLGALGRIEDGILTLRACVCSLDGAEIIRADLAGSPLDAEAIGKLAAESLLREGAQSMIRHAVAITEGRPQPLAGKSVVVTRPTTSTNGLPAQLQALGADIIEFPTIEIVCATPKEPISPAEAVDWLVFTSANAVVHFTSALKEAGRAISEFLPASICAVGPATAESLRVVGLPVTLTPDEFMADAIGDALAAIGENPAGKHFLLPRGNLARPNLPQSLRDAQAQVTECIVYETKMPPTDPAAAESMVAAQPDIVTFTSASTAENFCNMLNESQRTRITACATFASIGPQTTRTAEEHGLKIAIEPDRHDAIGLAEAIAEHLR